MDIIERIRVGNMPYGYIELLDKAAAEIERLRERVEILEAEIRVMRNLLTRSHRYLPTDSLIRSDVEAARPWRNDDAHGQT